MPSGDFLSLWRRAASLLLGGLDSGTNTRLNAFLVSHTAGTLNALAKLLTHDFLLLVG